MSIEVVGDMVPAGMPATFAIESLQVQEQEQFQEVQKAKVQVESEGEGEEKSKQKVQPGREMIAEPVTVVTGGDHNAQERSTVLPRAVATAGGTVPATTNTASTMKADTTTSLRGECKAPTGTRESNESNKSSTPQKRIAPRNNSSSDSSSNDSDSSLGSDSESDSDSDSSDSTRSDEHNNSDNDDDDGICDICGDGVSYDDNPILMCDGCDVAVHIDCYGVSGVPEGDWFCDD